MNLDDADHVVTLVRMTLQAACALGLFYFAYRLLRPAPAAPPDEFDPDGDLDD